MTDDLPNAVVQRVEQLGRKSNRSDDLRNRLVLPKNMQPLQWVNPAIWQGQPLPSLHWVVDQTIPTRTLTMIGGDGGTGKTLIALQLGVACSQGLPWLGMPTTRRKVLFVLCEDEKEVIQIRLHNICQHYSIDFADLDGVFEFVSRVGAPNELMTWESQYEPGEVTDLYAQIMNKAFNEGFGLVVLDSLYDHFSGNENSRPHAHQFTSALRTIAMEIDGGVIVTAHPSLSGINSGSGLSGSTAWNNAVRSRLYMTTPKADDNGDTDHDQRILSTKKSNYAGKGADLKLTYRNGVFVRADGETGIIGSIMRQSAEKVFLSLLAKTTNEGRNVSSSSQAPNFAPKMFARRPDREGLSKQDFSRAMESLFAAGTIINENYGRSGDERKRIVRSGAPLPNGNANGHEIGETA
jgi:RecA-family ATPase